MRLLLTPRRRRRFPAPRARQTRAPNPSPGCSPSIREENQRRRIPRCRDRPSRLSQCRCPKARHSLASPLREASAPCDAARRDTRAPLPSAFRASQGLCRRRPQYPRQSSSLQCPSPQSSLPIPCRLSLAIEEAQHCCAPSHNHAQRSWCHPACPERSRREPGRLVVAIGGEGSADRSLPRQAIVVARYIVPFLHATNHQARALGRTSVKALCHLSKKWESIRRKPEKHQPAQKQISLEGCLGLPTANKDKPQTRHPYCVDSKHRKIVTRSLHSHPTSPTTYQPQCIQERRNCEQDIGTSRSFC